MSAHNLAVLHADAGCDAEAHAGFTRARSIFKRALGEEHPKTRAFRAELERLARRAAGDESSPTLERS